ncbi:MAG: hypothetical protein ACFFB0_02525 [Promethearchaeota archaeon]
MGKNVVIGGLDIYGKGGAETAITLNEQGYNIKALAGSERVLAGTLTQARLTGRVTWIHRYFKKNKIPIFIKVKHINFSDNRVIIQDSDDKEHVIESDTTCLLQCSNYTQINPRKRV